MPRRERPRRLRGSRIRLAAAAVGLAAVSALGTGTAIDLPWSAERPASEDRAGVAAPAEPRTGSPAPAVPDRNAAHGPYLPVAGSFDYGTGDARFGAARSGHRHEGQDLFAPAGTPLVAVRDGQIVEKGDGGGRGNYVALYDPSRDRTHLYLHMRAPSPLRTGEQVAAGDPIGEVGCTGSCWGDHLHFEARIGKGADGKALDPLPALKRWPVAP